MNAIRVAHAKVIIVALAALAGAGATGAIGDWVRIRNNPLVIGGNALFEGLALLVYLKITRDFRAPFVSLVFAAFLGAVFFGDQLTFLSVAAVFVLVVPPTLNQYGSRVGE